jgi:hypothetical protein
MDRLPRRDHVPVPQEDFLALRVRPLAVQGPRAPAITRSPLRREWVSRVRRVPARMVAEPGQPDPLLAAPRCRVVVVPASQACHGPTRR